MDFDVDKLRALMEAFDEFNLTELELENENHKVVLKRGGAPVVTATAPVMAAAPVAAAAAPAAAAAAPAAAEDDDADYITSPFVGTFYESPSPTSDKFVSVGSKVNPGQSLCIVEAMKLMNEIEAEFACEILEVLVENGKPVEYGDKLFKVRKG